jgi:hypothetical protein
MPPWLAVPAYLLAAAAALAWAGVLYHSSLRILARRERGWPPKAIRLACLTGMLLPGMAHPLSREVNDTGPGTTFAWLSGWMQHSPWPAAVLVPVAALLALRTSLLGRPLHPLCRLAGDAYLGYATGCCAAMAYDSVFKAFLPR